MPFGRLPSRHSRRHRPANTASSGSGTEVRKINKTLIFMLLLWRSGMARRLLL